MIELVNKYFSEFTPAQEKQLEALMPLYKEWNEKINVVSRKDIESLYEKHVLHSLAIATQFDFAAGSQILDLGCGGGFPCIPLAIFFPEVEFTGVDSINKKLTVVNEVAKGAKISNLKTIWSRVENLDKKLKYDFVVSRAVAPLKDLLHWSKPFISKQHRNETKNGLICLKGGDLNQEISESNARPILWSLSDIYEEEFFNEKFIVYCC